MPEMKVSGYVRSRGSVLVRYGGPVPDQPLRGLLVITAGELEFQIELHATDAARLGRNATRMADHLQGVEAKRRTGLRPVVIPPTEEAIERSQGLMPSG